VPRKSDRFAGAVKELCPGRAAPYRRFLARAPSSPFTNADVTACLLGQDLWYSSLARFRDWLVENGERPHLWTFEFKGSCLWDTARWNRLSFEAKITRSRAGAVDRRVTTFTSPASLQLQTRQFVSALNGLAAAGLYEHSNGVLAPIASKQDLATDLSLLQIISHWLVMLAHRERILADAYATGFEVHGYAEACSLCRQRWGLREFASEWAPPFHPGCRCFAQPRFTS
jgi:hypothetical protein